MLTGVLWSFLPIRQLFCWTVLNAVAPLVVPLHHLNAGMTGELLHLAVWNAVGEKFCDCGRAGGVRGCVASSSCGHAVLLEEEVYSGVRHRFCGYRLSSLTGESHEKEVSVHRARLLPLLDKVPEERRCP